MSFNSATERASYLQRTHIFYFVVVAFRKMD